MKIYETKTFLPTLEKDKKKKSNIVLLSPNYNASNALMNHPLFENKRRYESYYMERDVSYYIGQKVAETIDESVIEETKRSNLPDSDFGIPDERKFPLDTEQHVRSAIKLFGHAPEDKKKSLARKISSRAKSYGIEIPNTTQVYKYLHEEDEHKHADHSELETIIFDIGGVLVENLDVDEMMLDAGIPGYFIQDFKDNFWNKLNSDTADMEDARIAFNALCKDDLEMKSYADMAFDVLCTSIKPCDYNDKILSMLKSKGYKLYYLSNWSKYSFDLCNIMQKMPFLKYFDDGIVSYQIGFKKPDVSIYELFKNKFDIGNPNTCLFIDDRQENVNAALSCGLNAVKWDQVEGPSYILNNFVVEAFNEAKKRYRINGEENDAGFNIRKLDSNGYNILYITGISGSGKSTLAQSTAEYNNWDYVELDYVSCHYLDKPEAKIKKTDARLKKGCPIAVQFFKEYPVEYYGVRKTFVDTLDIVYDFLLWFEKKVLGNGKYYVVAGSHFCEFKDFTYFIDKPFIIKDTNITKAAYRKVSREFDHDINYKNFIDALKVMKHVFTLSYINQGIKHKAFKYVVADHEYNSSPLLPEFKLKESVDQLNSIMESVEDGHKYYLISDKFLGDNKKIKPAVPKGSLDQKTERIRFYKSINSAMMAKGDNEVNTGREMFVHVPVDEDNIKVITPSTSVVPNAMLTGEVWCKELTTVKCIGKIRVGKPIKKYEYKEGKETKECHSWQYSWLNSQDKHVVESAVNESKDKSIYEKNFKKKSGKTFKYLDMKSPEAKKYITKEWINDKNAEIAVCKEDDELAGFIYVNKSGNIAPLKVYEKYRGYGIGDQLFKDAVEKFKGKKLGVYKDNEVAINLYKKYGFEQVGVKKYKDGDEVLIMEKKKNVKESSDDLILI